MHILLLENLSSQISQTTQHSDSGFPSASPPLTVVRQVCLAGGLAVRVEYLQLVAAGVALVGMLQDQPDQTRAVRLHQDSVTADRRGEGLDTVTWR